MKIGPGVTGHKWRICMKRISLLFGIVLAGVMLVSSGAPAMEAKLAAKSIKAGSQISIEGTIDAGQDLFVVISSDQMFKSADAPGPKEKKRRVLQP